MIKSGLAWLQNQLATYAGEAIMYHAGSTSIEIADAIMGRSIYEIEDAGGATVRAEVTDWLVNPARLSINDQAFEPEPGHRIEQVINGIVRRFEVQHLGSEPCWRWSGPSRNRMRIHTREIPSS
ncbi:MAG TPA: hypothetical protein PKD54_03110 [Pirellulaceae bacterium]|nr:hypothetical protein [Pirellulaceae bacterium]